MKSKKRRILIRIIKAIKGKLRNSHSIHINNSVAVQLTKNDVDLIEYLNKYENYRKLALFLDQCYALECLTFLASVIIFRHVLFYSSHQTFRSLQQSEKCVSMNRLFGLKFSYLKHLYKEYEIKINNKKTIELLSEIYSEYIDTNGDSPVNISGATRNEIIKWFDTKGNCKVKLVNTDSSFEQFALHLFDKAIEEIYDPLLTLYDCFVNHE
eukprot:98371_1